MKTILLAPRYDDDSQLIWQEAVSRGWRIERLDGYKITPLVAVSLGDVAAIYGGHIWGREIASQLGVELLSPRLDWLAGPWHSYVKRKIEVGALGAAAYAMDHSVNQRLFVKSLHWPQSFTSRVYHGSTDLPALGDDVQVLASEPVSFAREFRAFCLDANILTFSPYSRGPEGELDVVLSRADIPIAEECHGWLVDALQEIGDTLPRAVVVDVGMLGDGRGPAIVEANPAWCSGIYGCDPSKVLDVVEACVVRGSVLSCRGVPSGGHSPGGGATSSEEGGSSDAALPPLGAAVSSQAGFGTLGLVLLVAALALVSPIVTRRVLHDKVPHVVVVSRRPFSEVRQAENIEVFDAAINKEFTSVDGHVIVAPRMVRRNLHWVIDIGRKDLICRYLKAAAVVRLVRHSWQAVNNTQARNYLGDPRVSRAAVEQGKLTCNQFALCDMEKFNFVGNNSRALRYMQRVARNVRTRLCCISGDLRSLPAAMAVPDKRKRQERDYDSRASLNPRAPYDDFLPCVIVWVSCTAVGCFLVYVGCEFVSGRGWRWAGSGLFLLAALVSGIGTWYFLRPLFR